MLSQTTADKVIPDTSIVPATYTVTTEVYQSGTSYDAALNAAQNIYGTNNVVVVDITLKDDNGVNVTRLSDYTEVKVDIPGTYVVQPGNTVVVYYLNEQGVLEECETTYHGEDPNNRYVTFKTNHFSVYVLVEKPIEVVETPIVPGVEDRQDAVEDTVLEEPKDEVKTEEPQENPETSKEESETDDSEDETKKETNVDESKTADVDNQTEVTTGVSAENLSGAIGFNWLYLVIIIVVIVIGIVVLVLKLKK